MSEKLGKRRAKLNLVSGLNLVLTLLGLIVLALACVSLSSANELQNSLVNKINKAFNLEHQMKHPSQFLKQKLTQKIWSLGNNNHNHHQQHHNNNHYNNHHNNHQHSGHATPLEQGAHLLVSKMFRH